MDCWWCHNPESRSREPQEVIYTRKLGEKDIESSKVYGKHMAIQQVLREILKDKLFFEESGGGVTFSGGEPLFQPEALYELLKACSEHGLHTAVDTCGYAQWKVFEKILAFTDLFLYDLKILNPEKHEKFTGLKNDLILDNLGKLLKNEANVEVRIPVVPGVNNDKKQTELFLNFFKGFSEKIPLIHLLPYHEIGDNKYKNLSLENRMKKVKPENGQDIELFKKRLEAIGMKVGIGG